jgi:NAD(P)-dependent dehydrogenase (short-subunit alcohol dehydrogenase family)
MKDYFGYQGKRVVITGAASGIGQAAAWLLVELGAEVYALDIKEVSVPVKHYINTNLMEKDSIDAATRKMPDNIYALFNCAGLPGPPFSNLEVMLVNFVGHRHLTETLLTQINNGGAIVSIASTTGTFWRKNLNTISKLLATRSFDEARAWLETNPEANNGYVFSKKCIVAYAKARAADLAKRHIRINCLSPASTDTPMLPIATKIYGKEVIDAHSPIGRPATSEEMAEPLIFLNSNLARFISGHNLLVDYGWAATAEIS